VEAIKVPINDCTLTYQCEGEPSQTYDGDPFILFFPNNKWKELIVRKCTSIENFSDFNLLQSGLHKL